MRIAINTRCLAPGQETPWTLFTAEVIVRLAQQHPQHQFLLLFDSPYNGSIVFPENTMQIVVGATPKNLLTHKWWYDVKLPAALKKLKADLYLATDGICTAHTTLPQIMFAQQAQSANGLLKKTYQRNVEKYLIQAKTVVLKTNVAKKQLEEQYATHAAKIAVVGTAAATYFKPIDWNEKEAIKEKLTDGKEYFLYPRPGYGEQLLNLLKAFSLFKKRQQSNMQLVLTNFVNAKPKDFDEKLATYKYRNEVKIMGPLTGEEMAKLTAAAYALVYPPKSESASQPIIEALYCQVPIICSDSENNLELAGTAALYANPDIPEAMAEQMKSIYKDENLRSQLIEYGKTQVHHFDWQLASENIWNVIKACL